MEFKRCLSVLKSLKGVALNVLNFTLCSGCSGNFETNRFIINNVYNSPLQTIPWWRHQMKTFPRYWSFVRGIHRTPVNSSHQAQWHRALMFSLICAWINGWVNNGEAGDLRRHHAHYDGTVMHSHATLAKHLPKSSITMHWHVNVVSASGDPNSLNWRWQTLGRQQRRRVNQPRTSFSQCVRITLWFECHIKTTSERSLAW